MVLVYQLTPAARKRPYKFLEGIPAIWFLVEPLYTVTGAIRVAPIIENIVTGENESGGISNYQSYMNTQADIIMSRPVVEGVADDLVDKNGRFKPIINPCNRSPQLPRQRFIKIILE